MESSNYETCRALPFRHVKKDFSALYLFSKSMSSTASRRHTGVTLLASSADCSLDKGAKRPYLCRKAPFAHRQQSEYNYSGHFFNAARELLVTYQLPQPKGRCSHVAATQLQCISR